MKKLLIVAPLLSLMLTGCGSGVFVKTITRPADTGPVPRAESVPTAPFTPNYRDSLRGGYSWAKSDIKVYIDSTDAAQKATVLEGARLWSSYPGSTFTFTEVGTAAEADIKVSFLPPGDATFADGSAGSTTVYPEYDSNDLVNAEMQIRNDVSGANLLTLSAHEFGHALGIDGHSPATADCMNEYAPNPGRITQPDADTVSFIYDTNTRARAARSAALGRKATRVGAPITISCGHAE